MKSKIRIPESIEAANDRLAALDGIATATGWERAAIVYAFTYEGTGGPRTGRITAQLTIRQFAELKIKGLSHKETVAHYRNNWKAAIASGDAEDIQPGDLVVLPDLPWPTEDNNKGSRVSADPATAVKQLIAKHGATTVAAEVAETAPEAVAQQAARPTVARAVAKQPKAAQAVRHAAREEQREQDEAVIAASRMPRPKGAFTPAPEPTPSPLVLQGWITEFSIIATDAVILAEKARAVFERMEPYVTPDQVDHVAGWAENPRDAWDMVRGYVASRGASDEALQNLLNQE